MIKNFFVTLVILLLSFQSFSFQGGDGSLGNPYQISTCLELQDMSSNLAANYTLVSNIDCSGTISWNSGSGFDNIGDSGSSFTGSFNGSDYTINDLFINRTGETKVGLFGAILNSEISNVILDSVEIYAGNTYGGSLIGYSLSSNIFNVGSRGIVFGGVQSGGLVGYMNDSLLENAYFIGNMSSTSQQVGGVVGFLYNSKLENSYALANISSNGNRVGGLVGEAYGSSLNAYVNKSYFIGTVSGSTYVGGLVGALQGRISYSFSNPSSVSGSSAGAITGDNYYGNIDNTYWNNASGNPSAASGIGSTGGTTAILDDITYFYDNSNAPFNGIWDLGIWTFPTGELPYLTFGGNPFSPSSNSNNPSESSGLSSAFPAMSLITIPILALLILFN